MTVQTRNSSLAIKKETTEGTPVEPAAGTDFIAMQDDFSMQTAFESLDNAEMKASIGESKSTRGGESPTGSMSHYLRHSGVEGQAPNYAELIESSLGTETVVSTERDTVAGSTTTVINVDSGEGTEFPRGRPLLLKDATNGYSIRFVKSVSTDALTMSFALSNAPASGVNTGKPVYYTPANTGHSTLSFWQYLGGTGGSINMMSGARVTSMDLSVDAGGFVNMSYGFEGISYHMNPIQITASTDTIDWTDDSGTYAAAVSSKWYSDPHALASAVQSAMDDQTDETVTCTYDDSTGKFTIASSTSTVLSLLWDSGTNTAQTIGAKLGYSVAADDTGAITYTSDNAITIGPSYTPSYDSASPLAAKNQEVIIGTSDESACGEVSSFSISCSTPRSTISSICAETGVSGSVISSREVTGSITIKMDKYDSDKFNKFKNNTELSLQYSFGEKSGGNWVAGKSGGVYIPTMTIESYNFVDAEGITYYELGFKAFVNDSSEGEFYIGFV